uniref:Uncharacterized protein n=1 Tax=Gouania willdenowi TaxID=441366 RepID=A0A8C5ERX2_GOUWI
GLFLTPLLTPFLNPVTSSTSVFLIICVTLYCKGVDPELFELSTSKKDSRDDSEDTLDRLMSTAQKTCISEKKSPQDEDVSVEAVKVITELPNLSFMKAKVLMFPSVLRPPPVIKT